MKYFYSMIDIILLVLVTIDIGKIASYKGLKAWKWQLLMVIVWLVVEVLGIAVGIGVLGMDSLILAGLFGMALALCCYFIIKTVLKNKPDLQEDDISELGNNSNY